jgi:hypothetical protein
MVFIKTSIPPAITVEGTPPSPAFPLVKSIYGANPRILQTGTVQPSAASLPMETMPASQMGTPYFPRGYLPSIAAQKRGDWAKCGRQIEELGKVLEALAALGLPMGPSRPRLEARRRRRAQMGAAQEPSPPAPV